MILQTEEVIEHRLRPIVTTFARDNDANARRINEIERRRDASLDLVERHIVDLVRDQRLVGALGRHRELGETGGAEAEALQLLYVRLLVERRANRVPACRPAWG